MRVVEFDTDGNALGSAWMTLPTPRRRLRASSRPPRPTTTPPCSRRWMLRDAGKLDRCDVENVSYFISDGEPTGDSDGRRFPETRTRRDSAATSRLSGRTFSPTTTSCPSRWAFRTSTTRPPGADRLRSGAGSAGRRHADHRRRFGRAHRHPDGDDTAVQRQPDPRRLPDRRHRSGATAVSCSRSRSTT